MKKFLLLAGLCILAYAPMLRLPLMEDDYPNLAQALTFGSPIAPLQNPLFRFRTTSYWTMQALYPPFHLSAPAYHAASLAVHIANTWLLYLFLLAWPATRSAAIWAAGFFAVQEGHQEAVVWFSAINELLQFFFGGIALILYIRGRKFFALSLLAFALALISKESAIVFLPLLALARLPSGLRHAGWLRLLPYTALAAITLALLFATRSYSFRFSDGSFSLHAPFWITLPRGFARLMWFWGWVAAVILALFAREPKSRPPILAALLWMSIALLPYSFLTYSTQIPSRQTYLASAGLAALFGLAMSHLWRAKPLGPLPARRLAGAIAVAALIANAGYLWTRKRAQFLARAQPTEQLIQTARMTGGPIWIQCFPLAPITAEAALELGAGFSRSDIVWTETEAKARNPKAVFCASPKR